MGHVIYSVILLGLISSIMGRFSEMVAKHSVLCVSSCVRTAVLRFNMFFMFSLYYKLFIIYHILIFITSPSFKYCYKSHWQCLPDCSNQQGCSISQNKKLVFSRRNHHFWNMFIFLSCREVRFGLFIINTDYLYF